MANRSFDYRQGEILMKSYSKRLLKFYRPAASIVMILFCIMLSTPAAFAFFDSKIDSFSADMVFTSPDGKNAGSSKLYVTPDKQRMDGLPGGGFQQGIDMRNFSVISFRNEDKQYLYNHDEKLVFISGMDEMSMLKEFSDFENAETEEVLGKEKISGYPCVKKQVTSTSTIMGMTSTTTSIIWESDKFEIPLKVKSDNGDIMELRNIDTDKPSETHFRPLTGYKKVDNIMALMGMDFSAMARGEEDDSDTGDDNDQSSSQPDMDDLDIDKTMAGLEEILGNHMSKEEMSQLRENIGEAFNMVKQMDSDTGAVDNLWQIIPKRPGDKIGKEFKAPNIYNVVLGSNSTLTEVCDFYKKALPSKGWESAGGFIHEDGKGYSRFSKGEDTLVISYAENPGMEGDFKYFYSIQLDGPDI